MRKLLFLITLMVSSASPSAAQTAGPYRVDNFDFANLVRIEAPAPTPAKKPARKRQLTTTQNFRYIPSAEPLSTLTQPTSMTIENALGGFTTGDSTVDSLIAESGRRNSVDPLLLYSIMHQESTFKPRAVSPKGARGLMQLMPPTAARFGVTNIFDARQNIEGGARYMRFLLDLFSNDVNLALAGYNAGEGAVVKYGYQVPPYSETQEYVRRISKRYSLIRDPMTASHANSLTPCQLAATRQKDSAPLTVYEPSVFAARRPDGRLQLVTQ